MRIVYSPFHVDKETGEFKPDVFGDVEQIGLSTSRKQHTNRLELQQQVDRALSTERARAREQALQGLIEIPVDVVRRILADQQRRAFAVYDTAIAENRAHAEVFQLKLSKALGKKARNDLRKALLTRRPQSLDDVFGPGD